MSSLRNLPDAVETRAHSEDGAQKTSRERTIPSLDGLRAISVGLVVLSHYGTVGTGASVWNSCVFLMGQMGVNMFFVISGFLITFLLCKEYAEKSTISLKRFYIRRAFRIFPAFYFYLAIAAVFSALGIFHARLEEFVIAGVYLWNYYMPHDGAVVLGHTWSLALEEQFYLFWPVLLKILRPSRALYMAIGLILVEPFVRVATFVYIPSLRESGKISAMFQTRIDTIMFGCLIALLWRHPDFKRLADRYLRAPAFYASIVFLLCVNPFLNIWFRVMYHAFWLTLEGATLSIVLIYLVRQPETTSGRFVNLRSLRFVGVLSYSFYLWQQMFIKLWHGWFPANLAAAFGCAALSFYLIERPALRLRDAIVG
jgi:peptidoglycan/LPS O-acetylase OafA/YrhL